jgi:hypothetical protein
VLTPNLRAFLPQSCHDLGMGQMLILHQPPTLPRTGSVRGAARAYSPGQQETRGSAARGILLALALSAVAWIGLALLVPRLW